MKPNSLTTDTSYLAFVGCVAIALCSLAATGAEPTTARARTPEPKVAPAAAKIMEVPKSLFEIPATPAEGRNPFFPEQLRTSVSETRPTPTRTNSVATLVLNGITSPPRRTAMINGRTFDVGEQVEMRVGGQRKSVIKCIEIRTDSVLIEVDGERRELKLRAGV